MKMLWFGGSSYANPQNEDAEDVASIQAALMVCQDRIDNLDGDTPCVEYDHIHTTAAWLFLTDDIGDGSYPDRIITVGPKGGLRVERA